MLSEDWCHRHQDARQKHRRQKRLPSRASEYVTHASVASHMARPLLLLSLFATLLPGSIAVATVGSPTTIENAWWDPTEKEIHVIVAGFEFPQQWTLGLDDPRPRRFSMSAWGDAIEDVMTTIPEGSAPLQEEDASRVSLRTVRSFPGRERLHGESTIEAEDVRLEISGPRGRREVRLRRYRSNRFANEVRVVGVHSVPGRPAAIVILEYVGLPYEGGYTVQEPVLIRWPVR